MRIDEAMPLPEFCVLAKGNLSCDSTDCAYGFERGPRRVFNPLYEQQDDWSTETFWYKAVPSRVLPEMPGLEARMADL